VEVFHVKHSWSTGEGLDVNGVMSELAKAGLGVTVCQAESLVRHATAVLEANRRLNLTRITEPKDVLRLHVVDSLIYLPRIGPLNGPIVDIGSGAGYPGVPLAIVTDRAITLCESVTKKAEFLREVVSALGLSADVYSGRAEDLASERRAAFGTVVARAVASLDALVELSSPLLTMGGDLVALKGVPGAEERKAAEKAAQMCGLSLVCVEEYSLPGGGENRTVYRYRKTAESRVALPRRSGMAQRKPLARP
jgi:16S rRNA (guanine527-N7)-methyltransferase